jgi:hypothetical protein
MCSNDGPLYCLVLDLRHARNQLTLGTVFTVRQSFFHAHSTMHLPGYVFFRYGLSSVERYINLDRSHFASGPFLDALMTASLI